MPLVQVEVTVRAAGMVRPATERTELKTAAGGWVTRVRAHDNDRVAAGAVLLELSARDAEERLARNRELQREKGAVIADLADLTARLARSDPATDHAAGLAALAAGLRTPALARAGLQFLAQLESARLALDQARGAHARTAALAAKGLVTQQEADDAGYAEARAGSDVQRLVQQALADWQAQRRDEQTARDQLASEEKRLGEEITQSVLRAPVAGTVQGLIGLSPGALVQPGQSVGFISPDDALQVEATVSPRDIGLIRVGQTVRMQVDAFPYTQWGLLDGTVTSLAADATLSGTQAAFRVVVHPAARVWRLASGATGTLRKGMTLTARFVIARRSLLQLLYEDAAQWLDPRQPPGPV